jgi:hypothetical protein
LTRAFVQLCRPAAWRSELFPLLELLVEAADHRVHGRYIHHAARGSRVLLSCFAEACGYVREHRRQGTVTEPFRCLGFVSYESYDGERPMAISWRLEREFPAGWLQGMALPV